MNFLDIVSILTTLGIGGAVGAALALANAGRNTAHAFNNFKSTFHRTLDPKTDPDSVALKSAFSTLETDVTGFTGAIAKLMRSLKPR